jgi:diguanylate cyclase (GGDEF)-like protein/PAS domain S-box-containing protein
LRQTLVQHFGLELPVFFLFYPTVMLVALFCGLWPGLLATALSAALADFWIFEPVGSATIARTSDVVVLFFFVGMGIFMSVVAERYRRHERRFAALEREQALRETQERLSEVSEYQGLALEAANLGAWDYNLKTGEVKWDECCRNGFGFRAGELVDYDAAIQNIHPEDRPAVDEAVKQAIAGANGGAYHREFRVIWPDSSIHWISSHGRVHFDGEGNQRQAIRFLGVNTEITERKMAAAALRESDESLRESQRIAGLGSFALDFRTGVWTRSDVLEDLFGIDKSYENTMVGWFALIHPDDRKQIDDHLAVEVIGQGQPFNREYRIIRPVDGAVRWIHGQRRIEFDDFGKPAILRGTTQDITERKQSEERLRLAASVFSHATEGIMITTPEGAILNVNDAFTQVTGYDRDEVLGRNPRFLSSGHQDRDFYAGMWGALFEKHEWSGEVWNRRKNGEVCCVMQTITGVLDIDGNIRQYVALFHDITLLKEHESKLERIAYFDWLTGLPNRVLLGDRLRQAMVQDRRREQLLAVALLDLDSFKAVNDTHGHHVGDQLLTALAVRMQQVLREGDTLARLGGDEFVVVLPDLVDIDASIPIFNRLLQAIAEPVKIGESALHVSASIGVTLYPQPEDLDADQLLRQADQAMYQAKLGGRNRYQLFDVTQSHFADKSL